MSDDLKRLRGIAEAARLAAADMRERYGRAAYAEVNNVADEAANAIDSLLSRVERAEAELLDVQALIEEWQGSTRIGRDSDGVTPADNEAQVVALFGRIERLEKVIMAGHPDGLAWTGAEQSAALQRDERTCLAAENERLRGLVLRLADKAEWANGRRPDSSFVWIAHEAHTALEDPGHD